VTSEQGFSRWLSQGTIYRGWAKVQNGEVAEGTTLLRRGLAAYRATGSQMWVPYYVALLAFACEIGAEIGEALSLLEEASRIVEATGERWFAAELNRREGRAMERQGRIEAAEQLYIKALSLAVEEKAKVWELRAATSLARLWRDRGKVTEACELLVPVYGWFTEGFDTPNLVQAKALLDELA